jgi:F0F1-type ATP synthase membrane subunit b/b'
MLTLIIVLVLVAAVTFVLMRKGKIADANNNNIPDALENVAAKVTEEVKEAVAEVKEVVAEVKKTRAPKAPKAQPSTAPKTKATKKTK